MAYIFFSSHILVVAFQVPLAATQSASVFAAAAPANAGPVTASAMAIAPLASPEARRTITQSPQLARLSDRGLKGGSPKFADCRRGGVGIYPALGED